MGLIMGVFCFLLFWSCSNLPTEKPKPQPPPVTIDEPKPQLPQEKIDPKLEEKILKLIEQFSSEDGRDRENAVKELIEIGEVVRPYIERTLRRTKDAEVECRANEVIRSLDIKKSGRELQALFTAELKNFTLETLDVEFKKGKLSKKEYDELIDTLNKELPNLVENLLPSDYTTLNLILQDIKSNSAECRAKLSNAIKSKINLLADICIDLPQFVVYGLQKFQNGQMKTALELHLLNRFLETLIFGVKEK